MNEPVSQNTNSDSPSTGVVTENAFISYSHADSEVAERVEAALQRAGIKVWRDKKKILLGDNFVEEIEQGLASSGTFIFLASPSSHSTWNVREYTMALALADEPSKPLVIIPVLIKDAKDDDVPPLLRALQRVDLRAEANFNDGIKELVSGIKQGPTIPHAPTPSKARPSFLKQISFLGFFPEGLLPPAFDRLVVHLKAGDAVADARREGAVLETELEGIALITAAAGLVRTLLDEIPDKPALARETLTTIEQWLVDTKLFDSRRKRLGFGRSLLVRDLLNLAGYLSDDEAKDSTLRGQAIARARALLPEIIEEDLRIAAEINKSLMETTGFTGADYLMHARLLLGLGLTEQALGIFELYGSDDFFAEAGLDPETRVYVIQDWAKAVKDSGRAARMHQQLVRAYDQLLVEVEAMTIGAQDPKRLQELKADILNDRATQLAVYGDDADWSEAQVDIEDAARAYQSLGLDGKLLASRANFVSHSLDRFKLSDDLPPKAKLQELLQALDSLEKFAKKSKPDEDLFFYFYQKARLLKRLYPGDLKRAISCYKLAAEVVGPKRSPRLPQRYPIAWRWVLKLSHQALLMGEADYLQGLGECALLLKQNSEDAWAVHALYASLIDVTMILGARTGQDDLRKAWDSAQEAFAVAAKLFRRSGADSARRRLVQILKLMSELDPDDDRRAAFLQDRLTNQLLGPLVNAPAFRQLNWEDISNWLQEEEA